MSQHTPTRRSALGFALHTGSWVLALLLVYVAYVLVDVLFWPDPDRLPELLAGLPFIVGQIMPLAVFAATTGRSGLFGRHPGTPHRTRLSIWGAVLTVAGAAYAVMAWADPLLAPLTGSDALFPADFARALEAARDAARSTTGVESEAYLREAGRCLTSLVLPFTTAAIVLVAALLGSFARTLFASWTVDGDGQALVVRFVGALRDMFRWLWCGLYAVACWSPLRITDLIAGEPDASAAGLFVWVLSLHLFLPLLIIAVVAVPIWLDNRKSRKARRV